MIVVQSDIAKSRALGADAMTPSRMMSLLSVPGTDEKLTFAVTETASGEPYQGWLLDQNGAVVGRLARFRFYFVGFEPPSSQDAAARICSHPVEAEAVPCFKFIPPHDARLEYTGSWFDIRDYLRGTNGGDLGALVELRTTAARIELQLHAHPWSGICEIVLDGAPYRQVDLFNASTSVPRMVTVDNPTAGYEVRIGVRATGRSHLSSFGRQVLIEGVREYTPECAVPVFTKLPARNRGGAFKSRFFEILDGLGPDAVILDIGGGKRQLDDPRYVNLEYSMYEEPDIFGDALNLPFKTGSIDFVYSAAVLEHVRDPLRVGREIHRVLKPGGYLLANSAFMQPVHSDGQHFFNATPSGIAEIFSAFHPKEISWDGNFSNTIRWMLSVTNIDRTAARSDLVEFDRISRVFDDLLSYDKLMYVAAGVWCEARR